MKVDAGVRAPAAAIIIIIAMMAGTYACDDNGTESKNIVQARQKKLTRMSVLREAAESAESSGSTASVGSSELSGLSVSASLSASSSTCKPTSAGKLLGNDPVGSNRNRAPSTANVDHGFEGVEHEPSSAMRSARMWLKRTFGIVARSAKKLLKKADKELLRADIELLKDDRRLNAARAMRRVDKAWLDAIRAMQNASDAGEVTDEIVEFANKIVLRADELTLEIAARALEKARCRLDDAQKNGKDVIMRLQNAIEAVENAEVAESAEVYKIAKKRMHEASEMMRVSIGIAAELIVENIKDRRGIEIKGFNEAMASFGEVVRNFNQPDRERGLQWAEALKQSAGRVRQEAEKVRNATTTIMSIDILRIIGGVRKATYGMMRNAGLEASIYDENMLELIETFKKTIRAVKTELACAGVAKAKAWESIESIGGPDAAIIQSKIATAKQNIDRFRTSIDKMKQECRILNTKFNKGIEAIAKEERAKKERRGDKAQEELVSNRPEQSIGNDAYILQKIAMVCRRGIMGSLKNIYVYEKEITRLEQRLVEVGQVPDNRQKNRRSRK